MRSMSSSFQSSGSTDHRITGPPHQLLASLSIRGGAGALFPAFLLDKNFLNKDVFLKLAPYADDVWLNFWAWVSDIKIVNTKGFLGYIIGIHSSSNNGLVRINVLYQKNDEQIQQVLKYCNIDFRKYLN